MSVRTWFPEDWTKPPSFIVGRIKPGDAIKNPCYYKAGYENLMDSLIQQLRVRGLQPDHPHCLIWFVEPIGE